MKLFDTRLNRFYADLLAEAPGDNPGLPQTGGPTLAPDTSQPPAPGGNNPPPDAAPAPTPAAPLSSEGKKFLVELALKALAVDPDQINPYDKSIFETQVTVENADEVADKIRNIIGTT